MMFYLRNFTIDPKVHCERAHCPFHFVEFLLRELFPVEDSAPENSCIGINYNYVGAPFFPIRIHYIFKFISLSYKVFDLCIVSDTYIIFFEFFNYSLDDFIHASLNVEITIVHEFSV